MFSFFAPASCVAAISRKAFCAGAAGDRINVQSAGSKPTGQVHLLAIQVMAEAGVDISSHRSKNLNEFLDQPVHTVITVCGNVDAACPIFPGPGEPASLAV